MSRTNNHFRLIGYTGAPPEIRYHPTSGDKIAEVSIAVDASYTNKDKQKVQQKDWFDLTFYYQGLIGVVEQYVGTGKEITVEGYLRKNVWESRTRKDESTGKPLMDSRVVLVVTGLHLHGGPKDNANEAGPSSYSVPEGSDAAYGAETDIPA